MDETRWLDEREQRTWRAYRRMSLLLNAALTRDLAESTGLSWPDYDVLSNLSESADQRCRLTVLASRMLWSNSRMSHHITRMEQRGLVVRDASREDARGSVVLLTSKGRRAIEEAAPHHVSSVRRRLFDPLTDEQVETLGHIGEQVLQAIIDGESGDVP